MICSTFEGNDGVGTLSAYLGPLKPNMNPRLSSHHNLASPFPTYPLWPLQRRPLVSKPVCWEETAHIKGGEACVVAGPR